MAIFPGLPSDHFFILPFSAAEAPDVQRCFDAPVQHHGQRDPDHAHAQPQGKDIGQQCTANYCREERTPHGELHIPGSPQAGGQRSGKGLDRGRKQVMYRDNDQDQAFCFRTQIIQWQQDRCQQHDDNVPYQSQRNGKPCKFAHIPFRRFRIARSGALPDDRDEDGTHGNAHAGRQGPESLTAMAFSQLTEQACRKQRKIKASGLSDV